MEKPKYKTLGQETSFYKLFEGESDDRIDRRVKDAQVRSVLELGAGVGFGLVMLYYSYGFDHIEGMDKYPERWAVEAHLTMLEKGKGEPWPYPRTLEQLWSGVQPKPGCAVPVKQSYVALREKIHMYYGQRIQAYESRLPQYDLVIASNLLHFLSGAELPEAWSRIGKWTRTDGLIYVRVKPDRPEVQEPQRFMEICDDEAKRLGLARYEGEPTDEGRHFTYSNLLVG